MRTFREPLILALVVTSLASGRPAIASEATLVAADAAGDVRVFLDPEIGATLSPPAADLVGAYVQVGHDAVSFSIELNKMLADGGVPEALRFRWRLALHHGSDGAAAEIDGRYSDVAGGRCATSPAACEPSMLAEPVFHLRTGCNEAGCAMSAQVPARIDGDRKQVRIDVPWQLLAQAAGGDCFTLAPRENASQGFIDVAWGLRSRDVSVARDAMWSIGNEAQIAVGPCST